MISSNRNNCKISGDMDEIITDFAHIITSMYSFLSEELDEEAAFEIIAKCGEIGVAEARGDETEHHVIEV